MIPQSVNGLELLVTKLLIKFFISGMEHNCETILCCDTLKVEQRKVLDILTTLGVSNSYLEMVENIKPTLSNYSNGQSFS